MEPLALHAVHESLGATFGEAQGREVVSRYGDLRDEHAAARLNACLFDFSFRETLRLTGEDRIGFLQGMVTNDVKGLVEGAAAFAADVLNPGGTFVAKVFQSGADATLMTQLKHDFATVKHVKPASSRKDSSERYVLAMGFRGAQAKPLS